jgi:hypothetical protein
MLVDGIGNGDLTANHPICRREEMDLESVPISYEVCAAPHSADHFDELIPRCLYLAPHVCSSVDEIETRVDVEPVWPLLTETLRASRRSINRAGRKSKSQEVQLDITLVRTGVRRNRR